MRKREWKRGGRKRGWEREEMGKGGDGKGRRWEGEEGEEGMGEEIGEGPFIGPFTPTETT